MRRGVFLAALTLAGCASGPPTLKIAEASDPPVAAPVPEVALAPGVADRLEKFEGVLGESRTLLPTGSRIAAVFTGQPATAAATLRVDASLFRWELGAAGFVSKMHYSLDTTLTTAAGPVQIHAEGRDTSAWNTFAAIRQAIDLAVASTAEQVRQIVPPRSARPVAERLRELDELLKQRAITTEEHRAKREEILRAL